eukprot:RCo024247
MAAPARTLVVDNGACFVKALSSDRQRSAEPWAAVPNLVCRDKRTKALFVGSQVETDLRDCSSLAYRRPMEKGYLVDPECQAEVWRDLFARRVGLRGEERRHTSVVVTAPHFTPKRLQRELN